MGFCYCGLEKSTTIKKCLAAIISGAVQPQMQSSDTINEARLPKNKAIHHDQLFLCALSFDQLQAKKLLLFVMFNLLRTFLPKQQRKLLIIDVIFFSKRKKKSFTGKRKALKTYYRGEKSFLTATNLKSFLQSPVIFTISLKGRKDVQFPFL